MELTCITPVLGALVEGIDLRKALIEAEVKEIEKALAQYQVLIFRGQDLTEDEQLAFTGNFGPLWYDELATPGISTLEDTADKPPANDQWHADSSYLENPPAIGVLRVSVLPECGGDTMWVSLYAVYEALSSEMQKFVSTLYARHVISDNFVRASRKRLGRQWAVEERRTTTSEHPLVCRNKITDRRALYLTPTSISHIEGLTPLESDCLIDSFTRLLDVPEFQLRWRLGPDELAMWDQRAVLHRGLSNHFYGKPQYRLAYASRALADPPAF